MSATEHPPRQSVGEAAARTWFSHPSALVQSSSIGPGTRIWAFCHVMEGAIIGADCNIGDHCYIEGGAAIGDSVVVKNGVSIWWGVTIEDKVFVGPNACFTNEPIPRAKRYRAEWTRTAIREGASIGANATILCGLTVGRWAMVGAGAVVTREVPDYGLVYGNPARLRGFVCRCGEKLDFAPLADAPDVAVATCRCGRRFRRVGLSVSEAQQ